MSPEQPVERRKIPRRRQDRVAMYTQGFWPQIGRDVVLFTVAALVLIAVLNTSSTADRVAAQAAKIQEGRKVAVGFTCSALSAVTFAGRQVITQGATSPETPFMRFLEQHGYPKQQVRQQQAAAAGKQYTQTITRAVVKQIGVKVARLVVRPDGTFDCARLGQLSVLAPHSR